jgi:hypothetical protein
VRDPSQTYSVLAVAWFQPDFEPLLSEAALAAIKKLDWAQLAEDVSD